MQKRLSRRYFMEGIAKVNFMVGWEWHTVSFGILLLVLVDTVACVLESARRGLLLELLCSIALQLVPGVGGGIVGGCWDCVVVTGFFGVTCAMCVPWILWRAFGSIACHQNISVSR